MAGTGGKRVGAGAKKGSIRPRLTDYWSQQDIQEYFDHLKASYKNDATLTKFVGEHLMGKAVQPIGNDGDEPFKISEVEIVVRK